MDSKYKRAARWLRDVFEGSEKLGPGMVESAALLDLAAQLPEGEAERVLKLQSHDAETALREQVEAYLTADRVRRLLRTQSHLLANKSPSEIAAIGALLMNVYIAGMHGAMP